MSLVQSQTVNLPADETLGIYDPPIYVFEAGGWLKCTLCNKFINTGDDNHQISSRHRNAYWSHRQNEILKQRHRVIVEPSPSVPPPPPPPPQLLQLQPSHRPEGASVAQVAALEETVNWLEETVKWLCHRVAMLEGGTAGPLATQGGSHRNNGTEATRDNDSDSRVSSFVHIGSEGQTSSGSSYWQ